MRKGGDQMADDARDNGFTEYVTGRVLWLRKAAYLLSGDWHRADDLVQATVVKLYVKWHRVGRVENVDGYARTVLVNTFLAERRTSWVRRVVLGDPPADPGVPADLDGALDLRAALARLPARQRAVVVLRYYCDLSIEDTAAALDCSTGNVKSQAQRGLQALRRHLTPRTAATTRRPS
jgi:RNA polymerase sigma-70 factor (sigma-E family)